MKPFFDLDWRLKATSLSLACVAMAMAGCSKSDTAAPRAVPSQAPVTVTPSAPPTTSASTAQAPQPAAQTAPDDTKRTLQMLNRSLMQWMIQNRHHPRTFQEFANTANVQIPVPPPGKMYALDHRGFIVLVNLSTQ
ncbi:MAG TPA: hypothetical protein VGY98_04035 [Verrucomicrobiae bacterium]|nr:hypothetical protein [Verrucomicrobiae bacterium]